MSRLDEIVKNLARGVRRHPKTLLTWFDDAGAVRFDRGYILVKVDGFAVSRALYPWCGLGDFGFRGVTAAVSDVVAKGCSPYLYAVSIGVTPDQVDRVEEIVRGVESAVRLYGGYVENMDTNVGSDGWVDVFVLAECRNTPLSRTVRPADILLLPRRVGLSAIAFIDFVRGRTPLTDEVRAFSCRPEADLRLARFLVEDRSCVAGSIDVSDTLLESLQQISEVSGTGVYMPGAPSDLLHQQALAYAHSEGVDPLHMLLGSNEEYVPIMAIRPWCVDEVCERLEALHLEPRVLGTVTGVGGVTWRGVKVPSIVWDYVAGRVTITQ
ncbi:MAG: AIR synthase related protein [Zestosphaera sp.]